MNPISGQSKKGVSGLPSVYYRIFLTLSQAAEKGHKLLKSKADALQMKFRQILRKIVETKQTMGEVMKDAAFSLAEAKFACGDFNQPVLQNVNKAQLKVA